MEWNNHTNICTYRVKPNARKKFLELLKIHWSTLRKNGLAAATPPIFFEANSEFEPSPDETGTTFVEIFCWENEKSSALAHRIPEVMSVWEPMGGLVEDRDGRPGMEFPSFKALNLDDD